jgi:hypothetical protein
VPVATHLIVFSRGRHRLIAALLESLDGQRLLEHRCLFGGDTAIALRHGEFRESFDIDFIVSDAGGYRELRSALSGRDGLSAILRTGHSPTQTTEIRCDQYGIRTVVTHDGRRIRFEIVLEARIELEPPRDDDIVCGVATLSRLDMLTTKLLANADRWRDDSTFSRDLIDLAMIRPAPTLLAQAVAKAEAAYGASVRRDLTAAVDLLRSRVGRLDRCIEALKMDTTRVELWDKIRRFERAVSTPRRT